MLNDADPQEAQLALRRLTEDAILQGEHHQGHDDDRIAPEGPIDGPRVSAGDVIDMHLFLDEFDGDFRALFRS